MKNNSRIILLVLLLVLSISCNLLTPSTTSTLIAASASITDTPVVSAPTSAPTRLNVSGPYVIFAGQGGMWISNQDGSFLTQVSNLDMSGSDLRQAISPKGDQLALVVKNDQGLDLVEVAIPSGETKTIADLLDITNDELNNATGHKAITDYAITEYNSVAWQPGDGGLLAFMGAVKGPTSDLYTYDPSSGKVTQLTDGSSQAILPSWSPDGQYILHYGVDWVPPFGGAIGPYNQLDGVWAVHVPDGKIITEPKPKGTLYNILVGWQDDTHYLTYDSDDTSGDVPPCSYSNLHSVDIISGKTSQIMPWDFNGGIVQSPQNKAIIFASKTACSQTPGNGTFLLAPGQTTPTKLLDETTDVEEFDWLPESGVFQAYPIALFSADGLTRYDPPTSDSSFHPAVSKKGYQAWEVVENQRGRVEVKTSSEDWKTILNVSVNQLIWDPVNGDTLLIAASDDSLYAASYQDFTPRLMGNMKRVQQAIWLP